MVTFITLDIFNIANVFSIV